jgi:hypothetical protein
MHKTVMRQLLPLAVVCLLAAQMAAGARVGAGRSLLQRPPPTPVNLTRQQFVQVRALRSGAYSAYEIMRPAQDAMTEIECLQHNPTANSPLYKKTPLLYVDLSPATQLARHGCECVLISWCVCSCLQATWALEGVSCDDVSTQLNNAYVNNTLAQRVVGDFKAELTKQGWPEAAKTVVAVRQPCVTFNVSGDTCLLLQQITHCCLQAGRTEILWHTLLT